MVQKFRRVDPRFWTDEKVQGLDSDGKLLALWLLTCSRVNRCGIVLWSAGLASEETGIQRNKIDTVLHTVCSIIPWKYEKRINTVFLSHWWRYNRPDNIKALQGAMSDLRDVPRSGLFDSLLLASKDLPVSMRQVYEELLHTVFDTVSIQEQDNEQKQEVDDAPKRESTAKLIQAEKRFIQLWNKTPGVRTARGEVLTESRRKAFRVRMGEKDWATGAKEALAKFPLRCFQEGPGSWKPDIEWFLRSDTVLRILEGKYDWVKGLAPQPQPGPVESDE